MPSARTDSVGIGAFPEIAGAADLGAIARAVVERFDAAPCAVIAAAVRREGRFRFGFGVAGAPDYDPEAPRAELDTPFDLASLSKPVTALLLARLERSGAVRRDTPLGALLPALAGSR